MLQDMIMKSFLSCSELVLDFSDVDYISSAGLRALLIGQKTAVSKGGSMKLINVSESVLSILDMIGFTKILTISRKE
jgi:anti-anti-sigma factor